MKIAICIPTYNQADFLPIAIESALKQDGVDTEVWVADDCSSDGTCEVIESFEGEDRFHAYRNPTNQGIAGNVNHLLQKPSTEYIVRLDSDDVLLPHYCSTLSEMLSMHKNAAVAHCAVEEIDENGRHRRHRMLARKAGAEQPERALRNARLGYKVSANICMFRRSAISDIPVCRENMNFCEDWDLFARLADLGWQNVYTSETLAQYRVWTDSSGYRAGRKAQELRGILQLFDETLRPAWNRRNWKFEELSEARRDLARRHTKALLETPKDSPDYTLVYDLLCSLAEEEEVIRNELARADHPLSKVLQRFSALKGAARDAVKATLFKNR